jgi:threonine dehydrogenase-like Zn-dependent dehydrogenase
MKAIVYGAGTTEIRSELLPGLRELQVATVPDPTPPADDWIVVRSLIAGICGSDLGTLQDKSLPFFEPFSSAPLVLGHELLGVVESVGPAVRDLRVGQRVAVDPTLACTERGFADPCSQCRSGRPNLCERFTQGVLTPGLLIGGCADTGGGWGEYYIARGERAHVVPDGIEDGEASLIEPFSVALRPSLEHPPEPGQIAMVIGAGMIGLMSIAALKAVEPDCRVISIARHSFQRQCARELGAELVIDPGGSDIIARIGELTQSQVHGLSDGDSLLAGGVHLVHDTVTNRASMDLALRVTRGKGKVVLIGLPSGLQDLDWGIVVFKELQLVGSLMYGNEGFESGELATFARAIEFLRTRRVDLRAIQPRTHPIDNYVEALTEAAVKTGRDAIKLSFAF